MAFYDGIGKKISKTGQEAAQKEKNFAEINRLNSEISKLERGINAAYTEIGKTYYIRHADTSEDEFLAQFREISENMRKIEECQAQIRTVRGVTKCKNCSAELSVNAVLLNLGIPFLTNMRLRTGI